MAEKSCKYLRVLILLNLLIIFCIFPIIAEKSNDYCAPWVTKTTTNSATINWRGENDGTGLIDYATSSYFNKHHRFEKKIASSIAAQYQHAPLNGLEPNTSYITPLLESVSSYGINRSEFKFNLQIWDIFLIKL